MHWFNKKAGESYQRADNSCNCVVESLGYVLNGEGKMALLEV